MTTTTRSRRHWAEKCVDHFGHCSVCGQPSPTASGAGTQHDHIAHEVWALETAGMYAVRYEDRPFVEYWAALLSIEER